MSTETRAELSTAEINDLDDSDFAYIEPGGEKDDTGKTTPRSLRHYPVQDKGHADNALARAEAQIAGDDADAKAIAEKALPAIKAAVKRFADEKEAKAARWAIEHRDGMSYGDMEDLLAEALAIRYPSVDGWGPWVCDFSDDWVIFSCDGETKQISYSLDGSTVTFVEPAVAVTAKTTWVPIDITVTVQQNGATSVTENRTARPKKPRHRAGIPAGVEVRHFASTGLELRDNGTNTLQLVGTPIVYDTPYQVRDMFGTFSETMKPGVVSDLLANGCDTRFLFNHGGLPLARTTSGTLTLEDSARGLTCVANLDARQQLATDLAVAVERGDVTQMSVGMIVGEDEWLDNETRNIFKLKALEDVSAVTYPASPTTDIAVATRMLAEAPVESRERVRRMWAITRDLRDGRPVDPGDIDMLSDGLRAFAQADDELRGREIKTERRLVAEGTDRMSLLIEAASEVELAFRSASSVEKWSGLVTVRAAVLDAIATLRAAPTPQDKGILSKIKAAHQAIADAIHAQAADPDNATDPVDAEVMAALQNAHKAAAKALGAQAIDGAPEAAKCTDCGADNTAGAKFCSSCGKALPAPGTLGGATGDIGAIDPSGQSLQDGTGGIRSEAPAKPKTTAELRRELELLKIQRSQREREQRKSA